MLLLVAGFSLFLLRKRGRTVLISMVICFAAGLGCITCAGYLATTVTNIAGEYDFADVDPGDYSINASVPGYFSEHISGFTVNDGTNNAPDITLYPIPAGYLISTDTVVGNMRGMYQTGHSPRDPRMARVRILLNSAGIQMRRSSHIH